MSNERDIAPVGVGNCPDAHRDVSMLFKRLRTITSVAQQAAKASQYLALHDEHRVRVQAQIARLRRSPETRPLAIALDRMYSSTPLRDLPAVEVLEDLVSGPLTAEKIKRLPRALADVAAVLKAALDTLCRVAQAIRATVETVAAEAAASWPISLAVPTCIPYQRLALIESVQTHAPGPRHRLMLAV